MDDKTINESLEAKLAGLRESPQALLLFDYDGTLVPIVSHPAWARPDQDLLGLLGQLCAQPRYTVGIVSGRRVQELAQFFEGLSLYLVGLHGGEAITPKGTYINYVGDHSVASLALRTLAAKARGLLQQLNQPAGFLVEDKGIALALHYRGAAPADAAKVVPQFLAWAEESSNRSDLEIIRGKKVVEVRPQGINKGKAVERMVASWPGSLCPGAAILYVGDDVTDEDAFKALGRRKEALTIYIGEAGEGGRPTAAGYCLASPWALRQLIRRYLL